MFVSGGKFWFFFNWINVIYSMGSLQKVSNHLYLLTLSVFLFLLSKNLHVPILPFGMENWELQDLIWTNLWAVASLILKTWCYNYYLLITGVFSAWIPKLSNKGDSGVSDLWAGGLRYSVHLKLCVKPTRSSPTVLMWHSISCSGVSLATSKCYLKLGWW